MGSAERRERERNEIRTQILDAARRLFATEGLENVTMRRIADAIEYSPTTIYNHFPDKTALIRSLCDTDFGGLLASLSELREAADPIEHIRQIGRVYARFGIDHPHHYRFMFMTPPPRELPVHCDDRESGPGIHAFRLLVHAVSRAIEAGKLRDEGGAVAMAYVLWASLHGAIALRTTYEPEEMPEQPFPEDLPDRIIETNLRSFRKEG
jgi:AcrR family transcriptional regulator